MVKITTSRFGEIQVESKDIVELPKGLIGFLDLKQYVILDHDQESPFKWLQSLDDGEIAFVILNPLLFMPNYIVEINESEVADLDLKQEEDAVVSVIITTPGNPESMTANLKAPLIFNLKNRKGKQIILSNQEYSTRHNVMEELKKLADASEKEKLEASTESLIAADVAAKKTSNSKKTKVS